jgi:N utilization substance protein B
MLSKRQIREAAVQFLYCADLEGGADPTALRAPFWDFVSESDRRNLDISIFRTVHHLALGREGRVLEFYERQRAACQMLAAWPEAESLKGQLERVAELEGKWTGLHASLVRLPKDNDSVSGMEDLSSELDDFFANDQQLVRSRELFLDGIKDHPKLTIPLEAVVASIRRLQRISDRLRMVEEPEKFPEHTELAGIRESKNRLSELRTRCDELVDAVLSGKDQIDSILAEVVDHYSPERIDPVDRAILRLATHELLQTDTPANVVINEAVELAKKFGTNNSGKFVNGILDQIANRAK